MPQYKLLQVLYQCRSPAYLADLVPRRPADGAGQAAGTWLGTLVASDASLLNVLPIGPIYQLTLDAVVAAVRTGGRTPRHPYGRALRADRCRWLGGRARCGREPVVGMQAADPSARAQADSLTAAFATRCLGPDDAASAVSASPTMRLADAEWADVLGALADVRPSRRRAARTVLKALCSEVPALTGDLVWLASLSSTASPERARIIATALVSALSVESDAAVASAYWRTCAPLDAGRAMASVRSRSVPRALPCSRASGGRPAH